MSAQQRKNVEECDARPNRFIRAGNKRKIVVIQPGSKEPNVFLSLYIVD